MISKTNKYNNNELHLLLEVSCPHRNLVFFQPAGFTWPECKTNFEKGENNCFTYRNFSFQKRSSHSKSLLTFHWNIMTRQATNWTSTTSIFSGHINTHLFYFVFICHWTTKREKAVPNLLAAMLFLPLFSQYFSSFFSGGVKVCTN